MRLQRRRFDQASDVRKVPRGRIEVVELDDTVVGQLIYEPGWRWSVDMKPIAGTDACQFHHLGISLSGHARALMPDGTFMDLVDGSDLALEDAGIFELKGLHGRRQLYRLVSTPPR